MAKDALVFSDKRDSILSLITAGEQIAYELGGKVYAAMLGYNVRDLANEVAKFTDRVIVVDSPNLGVYDVGMYAWTLERIAKEYRPKAILIDSSIRGRALVASLAERLSTGGISEAININVKPELTFQRKVYGGGAISTLAIPTSPNIVAIKPGVYSQAKVKDKPGEVIEFEIEAIPKPRIAITEVKKKVITVRLEDAKKVVVAGRGVARREDLRLVEELASAIEGVVGVSRPLAADYGWAPIWVGMSGVTIKPDLYIGIGVSGDTPHVEGIRDSKIIVAINKDRNAPIFDIADYGIIGDLYQVVPRLSEEIKERLKGSS